ncbi:segregation/condensation protein A [Acidocella aquatica]|uniref:Segregation and condensation protein A n=1 Tax=Acidocella aquatica TaxID=1922313 RepID=A0ABQ6ABQ0_9PROT|nr:segregation/condensation protein A [Acidocella aquatica]
MNEASAPSTGSLELHLESFDGPLYLLLDLARRQQVDLARISVTELADQYVAAITELDKIDIGRAIEWLVMAAWLTWLKSRLLLPKSLPETQEAEKAAQVLTDRLTALERVRLVTAWLEDRPQLGHDTFVRGWPRAPAGPPAASEYLDLFEACLSVVQEQQGRLAAQYKPSGPRTLWTPAYAMQRITAVLKEKTTGCSLMRFLPSFPDGMPDREFHIRSAVASTLIATLELTRDGTVEVTQKESFGPIHVRPAMIDLGL